MTNKELAFIDYYLQVWEKTKAARLAGYKHPAQAGYRLFNKSSVSAEIQRRIAERAMSADEVLDRLAQHARGAWAEYINDDGSVDLAKLKEDKKTHFIHKTKTARRTYKDGSVEVTGEVEFYDSQAALVHIGRHHKLFTDKVESETTIHGAIPIQSIDYADSIKSLKPDE